jgi:hypothetical protein
LFHVFALDIYIAKNKQNKSKKLTIKIHQN